MAKPVNLLAAVSLLLCAAVVVLWVRSHSAHEPWRSWSAKLPNAGERWDSTSTVDRDDQGVTHTLAITSSRGRLEFGAYQTTAPVPADEWAAGFRAWSHGRKEPFALRRPQPVMPPTRPPQPLAPDFLLVLKTQEITPETFYCPPASRPTVLPALRPPPPPAPPPPPEETSFQLAGAGWKQKEGPEGLTIATAPHWFLVLLAGLLPAWRFGHYWRLGRRARVRRARGQCVVCGYDLRGSGGRCPECGTVTKPHAAIR